MRNPLKPRKSPAQARSQETVQVILDSAAHILSRSESAELNTNLIAERAGISIGSLYQYFAGKESILAALTERYLTAKLKRIDDQVQAIGALPLSEATEKLVDFLMETQAKNLRLERALLFYFSRTGNMSVLIRLDEAIIKRIAEVLAGLKSQTRRVDIEWTGFILFQSLRGVLLSALSHRPGSLRDADTYANLRKELIHLVMGYLQRD